MRHNGKMRVIHRDTYEAMEKDYPIEFAVWKALIAHGEARIIERCTTERDRE